jgi:SHS2 domain-containing protein
MTRIPTPGVTALDHTADVGLEIDAPDLPVLLSRAVRGLCWLLLERLPSGASGERMLHVRGGSPALLLREMLRELSWWHDSEGCVAVELANARVIESDGGSELTARALVSCNEGPPVREIKGVTLHGLAAEPRGGRWYGRVIFDV